MPSDLAGAGWDLGQLNAEGYLLGLGRAYSSMQFALIEIAKEVERLDAAIRQREGPAASD
jgi:hypothetical protein